MNTRKLALMSFFGYMVWYAASIYIAVLTIFSFTLTSPGDSPKEKSALVLLGIVVSFMKYILYYSVNPRGSMHKFVVTMVESGLLFSMIFTNPFTSPLYPWTSVLLAIVEVYDTYYFVKTWGI